MVSTRYREGVKGEAERLFRSTKAPTGISSTSCQMADQSVKCTEGARSGTIVVLKVAHARAVWRSACCARGLRKSADPQRRRCAGCHFPSCRLCGS
eukprot:9012548-Pyramimonas_sp.AAC.1